MTDDERAANMGVVAWSLWYKGGATHQGSTFDQWCALPDDGVLRLDLLYDDDVILQYVGRELYYATPQGRYGATSDASDLHQLAYEGDE